jgi:DNA-binding PadR family transcriptional regulator
MMFRFRRDRDHDHGCRGERHARGEFGYREWFGHRGRHGGGFRGGRMFEQGDLRLVILHLLSEKPRHGYEIIKAIEERFGGTYSPSPGVVYPTLTLLEELGHAAVTAAEGGKKLYAITESGTAFIAENRRTLDGVLGRMDEVARAYGDGPAPEIRRAVHNLRLALGLRLSKGSLSPETTRRITQLLDQAASEIERS